MSATHDEVKAAKVPSETRLRAVRDELMDVDEFKVGPLVDEIKQLFEDEDRRLTAAELGRLAYFTQNLRCSGEGLIRSAEMIEENFSWVLEDRTEQ